MGANQPLEEISKLYDRAENLIKQYEFADFASVSLCDEEETEPLRGGLFCPAVNELRYAGKHLLKACLADSRSKIRREQLRRAKSHCERAIYDVSQALCLAIVATVDALRDDLDDVIFEYPGYQNMLAQKEVLRQVLTNQVDGPDQQAVNLDRVCAILGLPTPSPPGEKEQGEAPDDWYKLTYYQILEDAANRLHQQLIEFRAHEPELRRKKLKLEEARRLEREKKRQEDEKKRRHEMIKLIAVILGIVSSIVAITTAITRRTLG